MTQIYLTMPQPGETITEGSVVSWMIPVGSRVKEGQAVVEIETEKALFEYESPFEGKLIEILQPPQSSVAVGSPIAIFEVPEDKARTYTSLGLAQVVGDVSCVKAASKIVAETKSSPETEVVSEKMSPNFSPFIRRLLRENNLNPENIQNIVGHGPHGRPTKEDVEAYIAKLAQGDQKRKQTPKIENSNPLEPLTKMAFEDKPVSAIRSRIAQHMELSKQTIPHAHTGLDVDLTHLLNLRLSLKADFLKEKGFPLRLMPLLFVALKKACQEVPEINSRLLRDENILRIFKSLNLGMAMGTKRGVLTPVVKECGTKNFIEFAREYEDLLTRSLDDQLRPLDFEGATFTFNNFGAFGLDFGVQVIPPGQSCVLGMGNIHQKPMVVNGEISVRSIATFFLAFDHRVMDGREAGKFLTKLKESLEDVSVVELF